MSVHNLTPKPAHFFSPVELVVVDSAWRPDMAFGKQIDLCGKYPATGSPERKSQSPDSGTEFLLLTKFQTINNQVPAKGWNWFGSRFN